MRNKKWESEPCECRRRCGGLQVHIGGEIAFSHLGKREAERILEQFNGRGIVAWWHNEEAYQRHLTASLPAPLLSGLAPAEIQTLSLGSLAGETRKGGGR